MSKHKRSVARQCEYCGKPFMTYPRGKETGRYCSRSCASFDRAPEINKRAGDKRRKPLVEKVCLQCGKVYYLKPMGQLSAGQKFCSQSCAGRYRFRDPKARSLQAAKIQARIRETGKWAWSGKKNPAAAERMRRENPMYDPVIREKARQALIGRTFLSRGGNGQLTSQQVALCQALGLPESAMEYAIPTRKAKGHFPSLPTVYKVDLAIPEMKLAIEVDGKTHKMKKWKFLDQRKTEILNFLGWTVLRFWNEEVDQDLNRCVRITLSTISKLKGTTTTSQTEY